MFFFIETFPKKLLSSYCEMAETILDERLKIQCYFNPNPCGGGVVSHQYMKTMKSVSFQSSVAGFDKNHFLCKNKNCHNRVGVVQELVTHALSSAGLVFLLHVNFEGGFFSWPRKIPPFLMLLCYMPTRPFQLLI